MKSKTWILGSTMDPMFEQICLRLGHLFFKNEKKNEKKKGYSFVAWVNIYIENNKTGDVWFGITQDVTTV